MDKWPAAARLQTVAAARHLPTATSGSLNSYTTPGDTTLHILDAGKPRGITELSKMIETQAGKRQFTRCYFAESADRDMAVEKGQ